MIHKQYHQPIRTNALEEVITQAEDLMRYMSIMGIEGVTIRRPIEGDVDCEGLSMAGTRHTFLVLIDDGQSNILEDSSSWELQVETSETPDELMGRIKRELPDADQIQITLNGAGSRLVHVYLSVRGKTRPYIQHTRLSRKVTPWEAAQ